MSTKKQPKKTEWVYEELLEKDVKSIQEINELKKAALDYVTLSRLILEEELKLAQLKEALGV